MSRSNLLVGARLVMRNASPTTTRQFFSSSVRAASSKAISNKIPIVVQRMRLSTSSSTYKGLSPESEDPPAPEVEAVSTSLEPKELTIEEYHDTSDLYIDNLVAKLEELAEEREDVDVEYSAGVLTLAFPPNGTYVINKQPPNKQIWLSSPISGPKRYDYVVVGEGQHEKEGGGSGDWIYIRDGSTLSELLLKEVGIDASLAHVD